VQPRQGVQLLRGNERRHLLRKRDGRRAAMDVGRGGAYCAAALERADVVAVLALVGGDHHGGVGRGTLHALLHGAFAVGASVVAPWERTVLDSFLTVLPPSVAVL